MVFELDNSLVHHWLTELRDVETPAPRFRQLVRCLSQALFLEAARDLELVPCRVRTPLATAEGGRLAVVPVLVPILRAGLGMAEAILELYPDAPVCHIGIYRDHQTLAPVPYYTPQVSEIPGACAFVLDPMLATGGSAVAALDMVRRWGIAPARLLGIIGAPPGVERVRAAHPEVTVHLCRIDERLNELGYIIPGLGDAGDRQFGPPPA